MRQCSKICSHFGTGISKVVAMTSSCTEAVVCQRLVQSSTAVVMIIIEPSNRWPASRRTGNHVNHPTPAADLDEIPYPTTRSWRWKILAARRKICICSVEIRTRSQPCTQVGGKVCRDPPFRTTIVTHCTMHYRIIITHRRKVFFSRVIFVNGTCMLFILSIIKSFSLC